MASYELSGSVTDKEKGFMETWENVGLAVNYIIRENRRGDEVYEQVLGQRNFKLSTYDRMLTEDKIVDQRLNPFKNGSFRPVIVPEDITIESNPNAMAEADIKRLFAASDTAWEAYMEVIDSPATLRRMLDLAEDSDISLKRTRQLESAYEAYSNKGKPVLAQKDQEQYDTIPGSNNEPRGAQRPRRGPKPVSP